MQPKLLLIPVAILVAAFALTTVIDIVFAGWLALGWMSEAVGGNPGGGGNTVAEDVFWSALVAGGAALSVWVIVRASRALRASWNGEAGAGIAAVALTVGMGAIAFLVQVGTYAVAVVPG